MPERFSEILGGLFMLLAGGYIAYGACICFMQPDIVDQWYDKGWHFVKKFQRHPRPRSADILTGTVYAIVAAFLLLFSLVLLSRGIAALLV